MTRGKVVGIVASTLAAGVPALFAATHALAHPDLDRDRALVRVLTPAATGVFRALDPIVARPFLALPVANPTVRAAFAGAAALGLFGLALHRLGLAVTRRIVDRSASGSDLLATFVALTFALLGTFTTAAQLEATVAGGAALGALLAVAPAWAWLEGRAGPARTMRTALLFALAVSYEPLVGAVAVATLLPLVASWRAMTVLRHPRFAFALSAGLFVGALPPLAALLRRRFAPELELPGGLFAHPVSESYQIGTKVPWPIVWRELGLVVSLSAAAGAIAAAVRAWRVAVALVLGCAVGIASVRFGAAASATRAAPSVVAALGLTCVLAGVGTWAALARVASAKIPFARVSAALLVLFDVAIVARNADDASFALAARASAPTDAWERAFAGGFKPGAVVLFPRRDMYEHAWGARTRGALHEDVLLVPLFDPGGPATIAALRAEPHLSGVLRDVALEGAPGEFALSELATAREVDVVFDAAWPKSLARHFVPSGLGLRFSIEPRGSSDRRAARETAAADLESLTATVKPHDDLRAASVALLRLRALACAVADDRDATTWAFADVRALAPKDDLATRVAPPPKPKPEPARSPRAEARGPKAH